MKRVLLLFVASIYGIVSLAQNSSYTELAKKAKAAFDAKEWDKSILLSKEAISLKPKERENYNFLLQSIFYKCSDLIGEKQKLFIKMQLTDITKLVNQNSSVARGYSARSVIFRMLKQYQDAVNDLSLAIKLEPTDSLYYFKRGDLYQNIFSGKSDAALSDFNKAINLGFNNYEVFKSRGDIFKSQNKFKQAEEDYNKAIVLMKEKEGVAEIYRLRAQVYAAMEQYDMALTDYDKAISLEPYNHPIEVEKNKLKQKISGTESVSVKGIETCILSPDYTVTSDDKTSNVYINLLIEAMNFTWGYGVNKVVDLNKSIIYSTEAIRIYPNVWNAYLNRAQALSKQGKSADAEKDIAKAKQLGPASSKYIDRAMAEVEGRTYVDPDKPVETDKSSISYTYTWKAVGQQPSTAEYGQMSCTACKGAGTFYNSNPGSSTIYILGGTGMTYQKSQASSYSCSKCNGTGKIEYLIQPQ